MREKTKEKEIDDLEGVILRIVNLSKLLEGTLLNAVSLSTNEYEERIDKTEQAYLVSEILRDTLLKYKDQLDTACAHFNHDKLHSG